MREGRLADWLEASSSASSGKCVESERLGKTFQRMQLSQYFPAVSGIDEQLDIVQPVGEFLMQRFEIIIFHSGQDSAKRLEGC